MLGKKSVNIHASILIDMMHNFVTPFSYGDCIVMSSLDMQYLLCIIFRVWLLS